MCGYNPFWIIESMLDEEYRERTGINYEDYKLQRGNDDKTTLRNTGDADRGLS